MANEIVTEIIVDLDKAKAKLKEFEKAGQSAGEKAGKGAGDGLESAFAKPLASLKRQLIGLGAAILGGAMFKHAIDASKEHELAVSSLNSALRNTGQLTPEVTRRLQEYADSLSNVTGTSEKTILSGQALLMNLGRLHAEAIPRASKAALDLAAATQHGAEFGFDVLSRAANGNFLALSRMGIKFVETGDRAKDFETVLKLIDDRMGGSAAERANTFAGIMDRLSNSFNKTFRAIGNWFTQNKAVGELFKFMADELGNFANFLSDNAAAIGAAIQGFLVAVLSPIEKFITGIGTAISWIGKLRDLTNNWIAGKDISQDSDHAGESIVNFGERVGGLIDRIGAFKSVMKALPGEISAPFYETMPTTWDFIVNGFESAFGRVAYQGEEFNRKMQTMVSSAFTRFRDGFIQSFAVIGAALVRGKNAFAEFGKAFVGILGDLMIQLGTFFVLKGIALSLDPLMPGSGAPLIGAGLAMIVAGGAMKAIGGGGFGGADSAPIGGVGAASSGPAALTNTEPLSQAQQTPGTTVNVTIQGNVMDRRQTGLEIVEAINEAFGTNGVVVVGAAG